MNIQNDSMVSTALCFTIDGQDGTQEIILPTDGRCLRNRSGSADEAVTEES